MVVERRKNKKSRKDEGSEESVIADKPSKEEYAVAKWIRNNVPSKKTKFDRNHIVEYFTGSRAVDALLEKSPWNNTLFESRQHIVDFLETMLRHKFFHRAKKIVISEDELSRIKAVKKKNKDLKDYKEDKRSIKENERSEGKVKNEADYYENGEDKYKKDDSTKKNVTEVIKKKPKVRLEMHMDQFFVDCNDAYVWIYEPIPVYYWFFGTLLVLGAISVCLFPLWPQTVRHGVWYLSIAAAGFLVFMLSLIILRLIIFCALWIITLGRHHLWLFPNLIEDVGFFASFWPLYNYEYCGLKSSDKTLKKKKRKKNQDSDAEDAINSQSDKEKSESSSEATKADFPRPRQCFSKNSNQASNGHETSEESSESEKSNTGADFELL
ncbi:translocation protein SEC62 [Copidosoma floridanum]|uniref:translocation protein SEC62 n=1 Tax=Copidosoma floridanum TaxID=29053 RepID=UPI0006C95E05|nr:translocation protein SEC62 [Copidosoma floridanum]